MIVIALGFGLFLAIVCLLFALPVGAAIVTLKISQSAERQYRKAKVKEINDEFQIPERFRHLYD